MLSPMDGAADKLLKGDLGGAGNEAMLEAFGGRVFKAAGKGMAAVKRHAGKLDEAVGALSHADDAASATATGVRESIEEASSVLAKEGGGVAKRVTTPVGELRDAKLKDAHHVVQDAAVRDLPGYNTNAAPGVQLQGPANVRGTPHQLTRPVQRQAGGGTYAAERRIGYKALRKAGVDKADARQAIGEADDYFQSIGVTPSTPTRIPGDRR